MMIHDHNITDTDKHFSIDPLTRTITNDSGKLVITQGDHNSERYTFEVPRYVEDHDMSQSTRIEVHFSNYIRTKKEKNDDVYPVPVGDVKYTKDKVFFSWLVSGNATQLVGYLTFSITFNCKDEDNNVIYSWSTGIYESISVLQKHTNTEQILNTYPDLYEQLKQEILDSIPSSGGGIIDNVIDFGDGSTSDDENDNTNPDPGPDPPTGGDDGVDTGGDSSTEEDETDNVVEF